MSPDCRDTRVRPKERRGSNLFMVEEATALARRMRAASKDVSGAPSP